MVCQRHVDDSPFIGGHWFESYGPSRVCDTLCYPTGHVHQRLVSAVLIALYVHQQVDVGVQFLADHVLDQELERLERLAAPAYEKTRVVTFDVEHRPAKVFALDLSQRSNHIDTQQRDDFFQDFRCRRHHV